LGGKGGTCVGLTTYHLHVQIVLKSGSLNLLEPTGLVQTFFYIYPNFTLIEAVLTSHILVFIISSHNMTQAQNYELEATLAALQLGT
jgi:hypothetical protein